MANALLLMWRIFKKTHAPKSSQSSRNAYRERYRIKLRGINFVDEEAMVNDRTRERQQAGLEEL